eukprot:2435929-Heterocapsa_arctica.AAC.1
MISGPHETLCSLEPGSLRPLPHHTERGRAQHRITGPRPTSERESGQREGGRERVAHELWDASGRQSSEE